MRMHQGCRRQHASQDGYKQRQPSTGSPALGRQVAVLSATLLGLQVDVPGKVLSTLAPLSSDPGAATDFYACAASRELCLLCGGVRAPLMWYTFVTNTVLSVQVALPIKWNWLGALWPLWPSSVPSTAPSDCRWLWLMAGRS